eukprot:XP_008181027.1 PREDICTED: uncharacterized protein LOC103308777 [Acyrthosiphon pisum]
MYRQVLMSPDDSELQRILYRASPDQPLKHYKLKTVTYGTKSASFLATRCLVQLADECDDPQIKRVIGQDFYVDDLISGAQSELKCFEIYNQLQARLGKAGFALRKWCSNSTALLERIPNAHDDPNFMVALSENDVISTLGLMWQPTTDSFRFTLKEWSPPASMTKRSLLSDINSVYDPIGLISPVLIKGKIFIQQLWSLKMSWDQVLSEDLQSRWSNFYSNLQSLAFLSIPRKAVCDQNAPIQIHGFSDASQEAFGACVYLRSIDSTGCIQVTLFTSKSRVAPIHPTTIPRLELCGALLLAELVNDVKTELKLLGIQVDISSTYLWSDSTIVIAWIKSQSLFQAYVANRLSRICDVSEPEQWYHVSTQDNPADLITRGAEAKPFSRCALWWNGPEWLCLSPSHWPSTPPLPSNMPEVRTIKLALAAMTIDVDMWISKRYSSWVTLLRITALVQRFLYNCRSSLSNTERKSGFISLEEMSRARSFWEARSQAESFSNEVSSLKSAQLVHRGSCLRALSPFIDDQGLIRVGGRLNNAEVSYNTKHPVVLSSKSNITKLICQYEHRRLMHIGPQGLLSHISCNYWIIRGRIIARKTVRNCHQCFRATPKFISPFMAHLPRERVTYARPFARSGLDFCGPILIRSGRRKVSPTKGYICVFVCMVTRAIHLELVSSLSTEDFLATLSRFMARRGQCTNLFSDNGSNFVGASRVLKTYFQQLRNSKQFNDFLTIQEIKWSFIPPSAPHFGGLWESAVKSAKKLLIRVTNGVLLTYDETTTLLCKIEASLNSRPLTQMSSDPADFNALTPGHFLVGGPLMLPPEPDVSDVPQNRLRRFKLMQSRVQVFWKTWSTEYLPQVQRRGKWTKMCRNVVIGDLAILKNENLPPMQWPLVRIIKVHPGMDNVVRAVTVRNSSGLEFKRPVVKLAIIPNEEDEDIEDIIAPQTSC